MTTTPPIAPADWGDLARSFTSYSHVLIEAGDLLSEHGENPEYDRAIVELTTRLLGRSHDEHAAVQTAIIRAYSRYANVPCAACGRTDLPLHTNGQCPECYDPPFVRGPEPSGER